MSETSSVSLIANILESDKVARVDAELSAKRIAERFRNEPDSGLRNAFIKASLSPVTLGLESEARLKTIHDALVEGLTAAVRQWPQSAQLQAMLPIPERISQLIRGTLHAFEARRLGAIRPDILYTANEGVKICEINARFPLNGFVYSAIANEGIHQESLQQDSIYAAHGLLPVDRMLDLVDDLKCRLGFNRSHPLWIIKGKEGGGDILTLGEELGRMGDVAVQVCQPCELSLAESDSGPVLVCVKEGESRPRRIHRCIIEMHQDEILSLGDDTLAVLSRMSFRGEAMNDFRTIFLVHDKRMLSILRSGALGLPQATQAILSDCIVPTHEASETLPELLDSYPSTWILKPCNRGKGEGILLESVLGRAAFVEKATALSAKDRYILQPYQTQREFDIVRKDGSVERMFMVGVLLSLDGHFYGPGFFRASPTPLVALSSGGCALFPSLRLESSVPSGCRVFATDLGTSNGPDILNALSAHGLALVGTVDVIGGDQGVAEFVYKALHGQIRTSKSYATQGYDTSNRAQRGALTLAVDGTTLRCSESLEHQHALHAQYMLLAWDRKPDTTDPEHVVVSLEKSVGEYPSPKVLGSSTAPVFEQESKSGCYSRKGNEKQPASNIPGKVERGGDSDGCQGLESKKASFPSKRMDTTQNANRTEALRAVLHNRVVLVVDRNQYSVSVRTGELSGAGILEVVFDLPSH